MLLQSFLDGKKWMFYGLNCNFCNRWQPLLTKRMNLSDKWRNNLKYKRSNTLGNVTDFFMNKNSSLTTDHAHRPHSLSLITLIKCSKAMRPLRPLASIEKCFLHRSKHYLNVRTLIYMYMRCLLTHITVLTRITFESSSTLFSYCRRHTSKLCHAFVC